MGKTATRAREAPHSPVSVVPSPSLAEEFQEAAPAKEADPSASRAFDPSNPFNEGEHAEACFEVFEAGQVVYSEELLESASSDSEESDCATETNEEVFHKKFHSAINSGGLRAG